MFDANTDIAQHKYRHRLSVATTISAAKGKKHPAGAVFHGIDIVDG